MSYQALLFCPDDKTAKLVTQVLSELDFSVEPSNEPFNAVKRLMAQHFDAVVVDCDNEQNATLLFKSARNSASNQSSLAVAVVEGQAGVAKAFRIGANLVLTKPINVDQAKGTLRVARGLLKKSDPNKAGASAPAASTPAPAFTPAKPAPPAPAATPRPSFTPAAPKAIPAPPSAPQYAQVHASAATTSHPAAEHEVHESAVLDLPPDLAPSAKSSAVRPAAKEYAWQPVSKPTGPMANAFKQADTQDAAEVVEILDEAVEAPEVEASTPPPPAFSMPVSTASAASAPAPARQKVAVKAVARKVIKPAAAPVEKLPAAAIKLSISDPLAEEPATAPGAAAPAPVPLSAPQKSGSNTGLIVAAVVLVLAVGGYFGWSKLHSSSSSAPAQQASLAQPAASASAAAAPATTPSEAKPSAGSVAPSVSHTEAAATSSKPSAENEKKSPASKSASSSKQDEDNSEAENAEPAAPQPMIVKNGTGHKVEAAPAPSAPIVAPSAVLGSAGSSANMNAIASTGLSVAKPVEQTLRVSQGVLQGRLIKKVQPVYPAASLRLRVQGAVQLAATISKDGDVTNLKQVSGDQNLGRAAEDAVRQWKYKPYMLDGRPVEIQTQISVEFKLPS